MKQITREEAEETLQQDYPTFVEIWRKGWDAWKQVVEQFPALGSRTRANVISDVAKGFIRDKFQSELRCSIYEKGGMFLLRYETLDARFKKLNGSFPSNIPTKQSELLANQQLSLGEELEPKTVVNIGYVVDKTWSKMRFAVSCTKGKNIVWRIDLPLIEEPEIVVDIPETDVPQQPKRKRVYKKAL